MNEIGISTASLFLKSEVEDSFSIIRKLGCEVVEVFLTTFSEYKKEFVDKLSERTEGLKIHSVHSLNNHYEPELFNVSERTKNDAFSIMREVLYGAKILGAHYYTFHGQSRLKSKPYNVNFESFGKRLREICSVTAEYDVKLCYENVHWALYNYKGFFKNIKEVCPDVFATLDIKQAMQSGVSVYDYIQDMDDSIRTIHICDLDNNGRTCLPGKGQFDFYKFFDTLASKNITAPCLLEVYSGDYKDFGELSASLDYLREISFKVNR